MTNKAIWGLLVVCGLLAFAYTLQRDIHFEKGYCMDLRNRVVGARLIKDGISPYFYKWTNGTTLRYYDPLNFNNRKPSVITSSPFLLRIFSPLSELQEAAISRIWLIIEYGIFLFLAVFSFYGAGTTFQRQAVIFLAIIFLLTNAWKMHIIKGQSYICIPFLAMLFYYFAGNRENKVYALAAGAAAVCLVLIKIYAIVFFVPWLFIIGRYSRWWLLVFFTPTLMAVTWIACSSRERSLWLDYKEQVVEYTDIFSGKGDRFFQQDQPYPNISNWEGIDMNAAMKEEEREGAHRYYTECGNFYVIYLSIFHHFVPAPLLGLASLLTIALLMLIFHYRNRLYGSRPGEPDLPRIAIFGFCLYMIADLYSPIIRGQYYEIQWIFPLFLAAAIFRRESIIFYLVLLVALLFSCVHLPFVKMGNTIGEYLILLSLLGVSLFPLFSTGSAAPQVEV